MTISHTLGKATTKLITSAGALALIAGFNLVFLQTASAAECLLQDNTTGGATSGSPTRLACGVNASAANGASTALGNSASAARVGSTAVGSSANAAGENSTAVGRGAYAWDTRSIALGNSANAVGFESTVIGSFASASGLYGTALGHSARAGKVSTTALGRSALTTGNNSTALGSSASAAGTNSTALGYSASAVGSASTAVGVSARATGIHSVAVGGDSPSDGDGDGAQALGNNSIVMGVDASDASFDDVIVIGFEATATEADQVILKSADTFTILGNGDVGLGTASPLGNLDINSGMDDTLLLLSNDTAIWEIKSNAGNGKMTFANKTTGLIPFKFGPNAVGGLLRVGIAANDQVDVKGNLDVTGTLTTGGPTCGGGCDAVFGADYDLPSIEEHAAAMYANSYLPEIGPTVPHAPMNISEKMGTMLNELEKAHIYIAQIQAEKRALADKVAEQDSRLAKLETLLRPE